MPPEQRASCTLGREQATWQSILSSRPPFLAPSREPGPTLPIGFRRGLVAADLHRPRPKRHCDPEQTLGSAAFFFLPRQSALDAAWMNGNAEVLLNRGSQLGHVQRGLFGSDLLHIPEHLGRQLVCSPRPTLFGKQPAQPLVLEIQRGLVIGGARKAERSSRLTDGLLLDLDAAQHFVLDLDQVVGIEEVALVEQRISHLLRAQIHTSLSLKRFLFARFGVLVRHAAAEDM